MFIILVTSCFKIFFKNNMETMKKTLIGLNKNKMNTIFFRKVGLSMEIKFTELRKRLFLI